LAPIVGISGAAIPLSLVDAYRLAQALEHRHHEEPFDVVQSSNYQLVGAFVRSVPGRRHLIRLSTSRRLYDSSGHLGQRLTAGWLEKWDVNVLRHADAVYAPSRFLADYVKQRYHLDVRVLRPPGELGSGLGSQLTGLPKRYLVHFGTLGSRKGSDWIARALPQAWACEPDFQMVWAGSIAADTLSRYRTLWGAHADKIVCLGPLAKPDLYRVVAGSVASVLPSLVDNLPNTVIESLLLRVPVIGTMGASIDELVTDGVSGTLIPNGDEDALAAALIVAWQGKARWQTMGFQPPDILDEMRPDEAVRRFLFLVQEAGL
jgi:glycosyltransferase involved in cell wall biosynthesis